MAARATTKTAPAPSTEVEEYDFDAWTEEDETAALIALNDVKNIIVEGSFVGRFADGTIVKIPLSLTISMIDELQAQFDNPIDQFRHLITTYAGEDLGAQLAERSMIPVSIMTEKYFRCLARAQELAFPESKPSSS